MCGSYDGLTDEKSLWEKASSETGDVPVLASWNRWDGSQKFHHLSFMVAVAAFQAIAIYHNQYHGILVRTSRRAHAPAT